MLSAIIVSTLVATGTAPQADISQDWKVHGIEKGKPVQSLKTDVIMASVRSSEGPALVFLCSDKAGLQTIYVYEPEESLEKQVFKTQSFLRKKDGSVGIEDQTHEDAWLWKRRHGTLQAKTRSTGIKIINAAFAKQNITFNFTDMEPVTLKLPEPGQNMMEFVANCSTTQVSDD